MMTTLMNAEQFRATFAAPMRDVTGEATNVIDIWPYVDSIPLEHLRGHAVYDHFVETVYRDANEQFDHVLVMTKTRNVYLVIVVGLRNHVIHGHHLLNLNQEYGLMSGGNVEVIDIPRSFVPKAGRDISSP